MNPLSSVNEFTDVIITLSDRLLNPAEVQKILFFVCPAYIKVAICVLARGSIGEKVRSEDWWSCPCATVFM